ncbi:MAG: 50S ribosomal protein L30 [Calditrichaeota bacterium]|nr:MAG: 50S ribosomal protein L30 [Calditrichota bacterium]
MAAKKEKQVKITQIKSRIGYKKDQKLTLDALGLRKMHKSVVKTLTPQIEGMIKKVSHLVSVEEV